MTIAARSSVTPRNCTPPPPHLLSKRFGRGRIALALAVIAAAIAFVAGNSAIAQTFNPVTFTATQTTVTLDWSTSPNADTTQPTIYRRAGPAAGTDCPAGSDLAADGYIQVTILARDEDGGFGSDYTDTGLTAETRYCYRVTATFGQQASDAVDVTTAAEPQPVAAVAAAMLRVTPGTAVTLNGSGTGQSPITNYEWECTVNSPTGVTGIAAPTLTSGDDATPTATFTAQMLVDASGMLFMANNAPVTQIVLHCDLVVTSGGGESNPARTVVTIANVPPTVSVATAAITVAPGAEVTLTGSGTGDPAPTFAWTCPTVALTPTDATLDTPTITPTPANAATATFTAPALTAPDDATKTAAAITVTCTLTVTSGGVPVTADTVVTIAVAGDAAADEAVLPNVLRNLQRGIHNGIYQRIQQRQQQDGKWK